MGCVVEGVGHDTVLVLAHLTLPWPPVVQLVGFVCLLNPHFFELGNPLSMEILTAWLMAASILHVLLVIVRR